MFDRGLLQSDKAAQKDLSNLLLQSTILRELVDPKAQVFFTRDLEVDGRPGLTGRAVVVRLMQHNSRLLLQLQFGQTLCLPCTLHRPFSSNWVTSLGGSRRLQLPCNWLQYS